ncbi:hypothetical protein G7B40_006955 [Aetokthonos hydrillicola Thurmond2011]|uniref:Uncharacterized protein n=1 Tax=Aetokthonos hydrillicola Thurmond2011 TaxID=2712845 RepID=A0AAP5I3V7_9CYAN|nr:hypothetical protein [Aetokthonos hydrillicola]MBO3459237.1 hypothetical protein [Aetokthonos hydrillicola CCALA 1050]MBW4584930.1 hypothetical protein [Aetokthonos hydrillicola CCALA 1050]MDR9894311.1 hypothetical protein [Aetokthonos hydrillicola Thurmond2011]
MGRSSLWVRVTGEIAAPKQRSEARGNPPRGCAWLRTGMASSNEVNFNSREMFYPSHNNLPSSGVPPRLIRDREQMCKYVLPRVVGLVSPILRSK